MSYESSPLGEIREGSSMCRGEVRPPEYYADHRLLFFGTELTDITDATVIIY